MPHYHHRQLLGDHCVPGVGPFLCCDSGDRLLQYRVQIIRVKMEQKLRESSAFKNLGYK